MLSKKREEKKSKVKKETKQQAFYTNRVDHEEFYWKKQETGLKDIRKHVQLLIFSLNSMITANTMKMSFHCKKERMLIKEYQQSLQTTSETLQQYIDSLQPIIRQSTEVVESFSTLRKELKDSKKKPNIQLGILYGTHNRLNIKKFHTLRLMIKANKKLFESNMSPWNSIDSTEYETMRETELNIKDNIEKTPFVTYYQKPLKYILKKEKRSTNQIPL